MILKIKFNLNFHPVKRLYYPDSKTTNLRSYSLIVWV